MYEIHNMTPDFPVFFHVDRIEEYITFCPHWHENLEILNVIEGKGKVLLGNEEIFPEKGDIVIINTNVMHNVLAMDNTFKYYCLIVNIDVLKGLGIDLENIMLKNLVRDDDISLLFEQTNQLMEKQVEFYKPEVFANALKITSKLARNYAEIKTTGTAKNNSKNDIVKNTIKYMKNNLDKDFSLEDICAHLGFTKCYFCHIFKEVTGITAIKMLNFLRCEEAKRLLTESNLNVSEVAEKCGFVNLSYFTKTYKAIFGELPSKTKK